jgi:hypothetical protein
MWLPYEHWSVANIDTRSAPMFLVARVFFSFGALSGLVRTASALCRLLICCSAPKMHISHSIAAAQLPPSRRDATTLEINTRSIDCTFGQMTKYPQQNPVFRPKWQNIAEEHVGNTQRAKHSSTIMRDTIRGRLPVWRPAASLQAVQRDPKYITTDRNQVRPRVNDTGKVLWASK